MTIVTNIFEKKISGSHRLILTIELLVTYVLVCARCLKRYKNQTLGPKLTSAMHTILSHPSVDVWTSHIRHLSIAFESYVYNMNCLPLELSGSLTSKKNANLLKIQAQ